MSDKFDFSGFVQFAKRVQKTEGEFEGFLKQFLVDMAKNVIIDVKRQHTPGHGLDTGAMRATWGIGEVRFQQLIGGGSGKTSQQWVETGKKEERFEETQIDTITVRGSNLEIVIFNPMEYASFVEFGHATRDRQGFIMGMYMLTISLDNLYRQMPQQFRRKFSQWIINQNMGQIN